jgi:hypothetical protein
VLTHSGLYVILLLIYVSRRDPTPLIFFQPLNSKCARPYNSVTRSYFHAVRMNAKNAIAEFVSNQGRAVATPYGAVSVGLRSNGGGIGGCCVHGILEDWNKRTNDYEETHTNILKDIMTRKEEHTKHDGGNQNECVCIKCEREWSGGLTTL